MLFSPVDISAESVPAGHSEPLVGDIGRGRVLVVDECRRTGGMAEGILTALVEHCPEVKMARVTGDDTYIPLGAAANLVLVQEEDIERGVRELMSR